MAADYEDYRSAAHSKPCSQGMPDRLQSEQNEGPPSRFEDHEHHVGRTDLYLACSIQENSVCYAENGSSLLSAQNVCQAKRVHCHVSSPDEGGRSTESAFSADQIVQKFSAHPNGFVARQ